MGAGASASAGVNQEEGMSMFEALKAQNEAKSYYLTRISEVLAKDFNKLKDKGDMSQEDLSKEIASILQRNEAYIMERNFDTAPVTNIKKTPSLRKSASLRSARRRSFDNISYEDISHFSPRTDVFSPRNDVFSPRTDAKPHADPISHSNSFVDENGDLISSTKLDADTFFSKLCANNSSKIISKRNLTLMAAVDGSDGGHMAFQTMMLMKKKLDHVCLFHAFSKDKDADLPPNFQADAVRARYENEVINKLHLPSTKFSFYWEEKKNRDIRRVIKQLLNEYKGLKNPMRPTRMDPNFFFVGYTGKKGKKDKQSTLGSVTDTALRTVPMPVIICKNVCTSNNRFFVIAVDGSDRSRNGFDIALTLIHPRDTLHCVTVVKSPTRVEREEDDDEEAEEKDELYLKAIEALANEGKSEDIDMSTDSIRSYYTAELESYGPANSEFVSLKCKDGQSVAECLVEYSNSVKADFFAISPRAHLVFTSVTEYVMGHANANIILCKS